MRCFKVLSMLVFPLLLLVSFNTPELHTTTANAKYVGVDRSLETELELAADHLTELLKSITDQEFDLSTLEDQDACEEFLIPYLEQNFLMIQNGKVLPLSYLAMEVKEDKVMIVFEVEVINTDYIMLKNTLLFDLFTDQINIVNIQGVSVSNTYYFNAQTPEQSIAL